MSGARAWHAALAKALIDANGGLVGAQARCRLKKSRLAKFWDLDDASEDFMPADVIADLERACGEPIYSRAMAGALASAGAKASAIDAIAEVAEGQDHLAHVQRALAHLVGAGGGASPRERAQILAEIAAAMTDLAETAAEVAGLPSLEEARRARP